MRAVILACVAVLTVAAAGQPAASQPRTSASSPDRPAPPQLKPLSALPVYNCQDPAARPGAMKALEGHMDERMAYMKAAHTHADAMTRWKADRMVELGVWTKAERAQHMARLLADPKFTEMTQSNLALVMGWADQLGKARDEAAECAALSDIARSAEQLVPRVMAQWKVIDDLFEAEAGRKGISLD